MTSLVFEAVSRPVAASLLAGLGVAVAGVNIAAAGAVAPALLAGAGLAVVALVLDLRRIPRRVADGADAALFVTALLLAALPLRGATLAALLPLAALLLRSAGTSAHGAALLLAALAGAGLITSSGAGLVAPAILTGEAKSVALVLTGLGLDVASVGNTVFLPVLARELVILRGCSLVELLPALLILMLAFSRLMGADALLRPGVAAVAVGAAVMLNLLRLAAMAVSDGAAAFFHDTAGEILLQAVILAIAFCAAQATARGRL